MVSENAVTDEQPFPFARSLYILGRSLKTIRSLPLDEMIEHFDPGDEPAPESIPGEMLEDALRAGAIPEQTEVLREVRGLISRISELALSADARVENTEETR